MAGVPRGFGGAWYAVDATWDGVLRRIIALDRGLRELPSRQPVI
jgi:hypothetical protein